MEKIKEGDNFIKICKIMSWLDKIRWKQKIQDTFTKEVLEYNELTPAQKVLAHWLIYITDRGKRADILWGKNTPKIKKLVEEYFKKEVSTEESVSDLFDGWTDNNKISAYPADIEAIYRTLVILLEYNKDIIQFMTRNLSEWKRNYPENFIARIACRLYFLSYKGIPRLKKGQRESNRNSLNNELEVARTTLNKGDMLEEFEEWYKKDRWHKRTWAALRDYKKSEQLKEIFISGIETDTNKNAWSEDFTKQLELPGDIWNIRFFENCIKPIAENMGVSLRGKRAPRVIRDLWEKIKSDCPKSYPEQFDITFDFAPRMCSKKLCKVCLFGPNGAKSICIPTDDKYCPVALVSCGYIYDCNQGGCIIKEDTGKGICSGFNQLN